MKKRIMFCDKTDCSSKKKKSTHTGISNNSHVPMWNASVC